MNRYWTYIVTNRKGGTLYIGVTDDLQRRLWEHREGTVPGFTKRYEVHVLVHFEETASIDDAIAREKQLKKWNRAWKVQLIESTNLDWKDLAQDFDIYRTFSLSGKPRKFFGPELPRLRRK